MKVLEIPAYECPYCMQMLMPEPQPVSPEMTHVILAHPYVGERCRFSGKRMRVALRVIDAELLEL